MASDLWVATLSISARTAEKISSKHGIQPDEVRDAVQCVAGLVYTWHDHPERGLRAMVETRIRDRKVLVVLYPAGGPFADRYNLGSAYFVPN